MVRCHIFSRFFICYLST